MLSQQFHECLPTIRADDGLPLPNPVNMYLSRQKLLTASAWMKDESRFDGRSQEVQMEG